MKCPKCKAEVVWGLPGPELIEKAERSEVMLAGCVIEEQNYCPRCGALVFENKAKRTEDG